MQEENAGPLVKNYQEFQDGASSVLNKNGAPISLGPVLLH